MKWFVLRYIFQIISGDGNYASQFDEQLRLIQAVDAQDALQKGEGQSENFHRPFRNCNGELVKWEFICIADLYEIEPPGHGSEVGSVLHEPKDMVVFLDELKRREAFLHQSIYIENPN
ncbi:DUF4288 domain-containing protein [Pedobacter steynii]|uniref:DUF4288 domain-containing protein n=1 Tax=Pedobacter steynii TaxID=430522 RepID=A0A1D7QB23_9SPHI|nr:DUF4288 domain-containing protein [Pedobacter steynii]AOM75882.1 hypothetical protein BFS30_01065 [Pedobacter steynii]